MFNKVIAVDFFIEFIPELGYYHAGIFLPIFRNRANSVRPRPGFGLF